jgi:ribosomal protein L1
MPKVAATFGKVLGPAGKMPSPQLGIITDESAANIKQQIERVNKSIKIRVKEASIKIPIAKENMSDQEIMDNIKSAYNSIVAVLPNKIDSVRNAMIKLTMSKAIKTEIK